jgi:signal-transduction protein with cAMP-binding, CBS, and nucleotidyltransferase domain
MTLFSDQDNALIFEDSIGDQLVEQRRSLLTLADDVCGRLKRAGYPYCPGGIMAANPKWCLTLSEWKKQFSKWVAESTPESILEINVFFDIRCVYGNENLVHELRQHVQTLTQQTPAFFIHYAKNCLGYKAPLSLLGRIRPEKHGNEKTIKLKECIKPIETFARIYALKHGIGTPETLDRLRQLGEQGVLKPETLQEIIYVFNYLWQLRFFNQISAHADLQVDANELDLEKLSDIERDNLQAVLIRIPRFQITLSYDFLGSAAGI